jgi:hypothetical protein
MSLNNDYSSGLLYAQRHRELTAQTAQDRLVRLARGEITHGRRRRLQLPRVGRSLGIQWRAVRHRVAH